MVIFGPMKAICSMIALLSFAFLASCNTPPPVQRFPEVSYKHLAPIRLDVKTIETYSSFASTFAPPQVEHLFPLPPGAAAERWARDRLVATGKEGRARFIVRDASVVQQRLPKSGGISGLITTEQTDRYVAELAVELIVNDDLGQREGKTAARASLSRTVPEDITLNGLEQVWFEMTEALMKDLNAQLEAGVAGYLKPFLK
ncbi:MAG: hypothetical protein ACKVSF_13255 [Alphaproteobacteria bacterium]